LARETEVLGENLPQRHFCPSQNPTCPPGFEPGPPRWEVGDGSILVLLRSRSNVVGIATVYGLDHRGVGVRVPVGSKFLFSTSSGLALGSTQPPIQWGRGALSLGVERRRDEADHSPPVSAEVKKIWIYISTPPYAFMA
jgi:hypothetical protein